MGEQPAGTIAVYLLEMALNVQSHRFAYAPFCFLSSYLPGGSQLERAWHIHIANSIEQLLTYWLSRDLSPESGRVEETGEPVSI